MSPTADSRERELQKEIRELKSEVQDVKLRLDTVVFWLLAVGGVAYVLFLVWLAEQPSPR